MGLFSLKFHAKSAVTTVSAIVDIIFTNLAMLCLQWTDHRWPQLSDTIRTVIVASLWGYFLYIYQTIKKVSISFSGDVLDLQANAILICNHKSIGDYILLHALSSFYRMSGRLRFLTWHGLFSIPSLKWICSSLWVAQDWTFKSEEDKEHILGSLQDGYHWIALFPESVRYSADVAYEHRRFCAFNGLPVFRHCLYPRFEAAVPSIQYLIGRIGINLVYDVTFVYQSPETGQSSVTNSKSTDFQSQIGKSDPIPHSQDSHVPGQPQNASHSESVSSVDVAPSLMDILLGRAESWEFHVHVEKVPIAQVPLESHALERWLEKLWLKKDKLLTGVELKGMSFKGLGFVYYFGDELETEI
ncbi:uncharacterized protein V2V93DRAFT_344384 [Kockiozyma suomiensis]|uniref:uncharacterized protein n=1 Tax=Kockiozyma suomiensis TaxID=1337062 RepID=UPI0033441D9E